MVESYLRDQKLNTIHEGTSGIQSLDLLGRKVMAGGGAALRVLSEEINAVIARARSAGVRATWCDALDKQLVAATEITMHLGGLGLANKVDEMLLHSADYLEMMGILAIAWQWLDAAAAAQTSLETSSGDRRAFYEGILAATQYWIATELPRARVLGELCMSGEDSYARVADGAW